MVRKTGTTSKQKKFYLTPEGARKLQEELNYLKTTKREEIAKRLRSAILMGDLSENADYIVTKEEQAFVEGRIMELETILRNAVIIEVPQDRNIVGLGCKVTLLEEGRDQPETYMIVGSVESDHRNHKISNESPLGKALMGRRKGEVVEVDTPAGRLRFKILDVSYDGFDGS